MRVRQAVQEREGKIPMCLKPGKVENAQPYFCPEDNFTKDDTWAILLKTTDFREMPEVFLALYEFD